jgi:hypothetical protein
VGCAEVVVDENPALAIHYQSSVFFTLHVITLLRRDNAFCINLLRFELPQTSFPVSISHGPLSPLARFTADYGPKPSSPTSGTPLLLASFRAAYAYDSGVDTGCPSPRLSVESWGVTMG